MTGGIEMAADMNRRTKRRKGQVVIVSKIEQHLASQRRIAREHRDRRRECRRDVDQGHGASHPRANRPQVREHRTKERFFEELDTVAATCADLGSDGSFCQLHVAVSPLL